MRRNYSANAGFLQVHALEISWASSWKAFAHRKVFRTLVYCDFGPFLMGDSRQFLPCPSVFLRAQAFLPFWLLCWGLIELVWLVELLFDRLLDEQMCLHSCVLKAHVQKCTRTVLG